MKIITSLSISARATLDMHSLNNEGTEGNQQMTRMVHVLDQAGQRHVVNAVSGDMLKHILVGHLTDLLLEKKAPVCGNAARHHPDRILLDNEFKEFVGTKDKPAIDILTYMLEKCAVTDLAGALYAEKAVARKSCAEFGWLVGLPEKTVTEQYFHVKYDPSRGKSAGGDSVAGQQAIFHRPASSGVYALISTLELGRIGQNDITRRYPVAADERKKRAQALVQALAALLVRPAGAQRNTQSPHIVACEGIISWSTSSLPAPTISPLNDDYRDQVAACAVSLNRITADAINIERFDCLSAGVDVLTKLAEELEAPSAQG